MGSTKRKLILSILSTALTVVCLTSTTYAWFARNSEAWTEEFNFEIENHDNLLISVDGENFRSSISNDLLKKAIVAKANNIDILTDSKSDTPTLTDTYINKEFNKIRIKGVSTSDVVSFTAIDEVNGTDGYFNIIDADKYNYLAFDLYFKVDATKEADKAYDLAFVSSDYSASSDSNVPVSYLKSLDTEATIHSGFTIGDVTYKADDKININLVNAMRIGVITDTTNESKPLIYEPYAGLGSYAIKDGTGSYNPEENLMYRHLNEYGRYDLLPLDDTNGVYQNTLKSFDDEVSLGKFDAVNDSEYNIVKITIAIWLEGYDADYLGTVDLTELSCYLSFFKKERAV